MPKGVDPFRHIKMATPGQNHLFHIFHLALRNNAVGCYNHWSFEGLLIYPPPLEFFHNILIYFFLVYNPSWILRLNHTFLSTTFGAWADLCLSFSLPAKPCHAGLIPGSQTSQGLFCHYTDCCHCPRWTSPISTSTIFELNSWDPRKALLADFSLTSQNKLYPFHEFSTGNSIYALITYIILNLLLERNPLRTGTVQIIDAGYHNT